MSQLGISRIREKGVGSAVVGAGGMRSSLAIRGARQRPDMIGTANVDLANECRRRSRVHYGGFRLLGGRAADLLGRRPILVAGTALLGVSSFICGLARGADPQPRGA